MKAATGKCVCGSHRFKKAEKDCIQCIDCGVIRRPRFSSPEKYISNYQSYYSSPRKDYTGKVKDYKHDREVAFSRCRSYGISVNDRILDVGSGSGAFVDECRDRGADAYGCEITKCNYLPDNAFVYYQELENIHFPTDYFDIVTCHDVLEHFLDPVQTLKEMFRITKQKGRIIIDFPNFFVKEGIHHWIEEHLWYFTAKQLGTILKDLGLVIDKITKPILGKLVFYCCKPEVERVKILVPPGIGDSYWSLVKIESFLKEKQLNLPDILIFSDKDKQGARHSRSFDFIEMFPFVHSGKENRFDRKLKPIWKEAYLEDGRTIFPNVMDCDYFIAYNGILRFGKSLEEVDLNFRCNWFPRMFVSLKQKQFQKQCKGKWGKYIVLYFIGGGMYRKWLSEFGIQSVIVALREFARITGYRLVLVGSNWDEQDNIIQALSKGLPVVNMVGKTDLHELFGMIKGSQGVVGFPSGLTIMSTVFRKKTFMLWNNYFHKSFFWNSCPPEVKNKTYKIANTKQLLPSVFLDNLRELFQKDKKGKLSSEQVCSQLIPKTTIFCVLKSGGDYNVDYVSKLKNSILRNTTIPLRFICLTDIDINSEVCETIKLEKGEEGWWSKIELFKKNKIDTDQIIYFDLDTIILSNIDDLMFYFYDFCALKPWNPENQKRGLCASGMMAWKNNNYVFLFDNFDTGKTKLYSRGDQEYISEILANNDVSPEFFQELFSGIYSYKRNCQKGIPKDARIICFHGRPRPHKMKDKWMKENWR